MQTANSVSKIMLGVGDYGCTVAPGGVIRTMALGSCVAVMILDRGTRCVGMDHIALPESSVSPDRAAQLPGYFADTGIPALIKKMQQVSGSFSKPANLIVKMAGGANVADPNNTFNIGKRNALAVKKILWQFGLGAVAEDVGGSHSRTVTLFHDSGRIVLSCPGRPDWEL
ncbi:MAG: chemotaxis protein CheD [Planctomycetaceae bacterium]|jgi:chemotaxis protein CheD|nr:chemotaxis protein CheD [Planctomycetaceae bacterium]